MAGGEQSRPRADEVEISVFGPGYGECVVAHATNSQWIIIDSCRGATGVPSAIEYLQMLGVDMATEVRLVIATHYHDDHIGGLGEVYERCDTARFGCSMALNSNEWTTLVEIYRNYLQAGGSGVDELRRVMKELRTRAAEGEIVAPIFCIAGRVMASPLLAAPAELRCLAPSDAAVAAMQARIRESLLPQARRRRLRVPTLQPNDSSVVLSLRIGAASALIGADLEERHRPGLGWQVILDGLPNGLPHDGFKIPHHGSVTGYHPDVWPRLVSPNGWAAITPYNRQKVPLPTSQDCLRISGMTKNAFITSPPGWAKFRHPDSAVQKTTHEATIAIAPEQPRHGHVRFRRSVSAQGTWTTELFGNARALSLLPPAA